MGLLCALLFWYGLAILARIVLSWFPVAPGGALAQVFSVLYSITEPVLGPLRRTIPPIGMFDLSPMVAFFGLRILAALVGC